MKKSGNPKSSLKQKILVVNIVSILAVISLAAAVLISSGQYTRSINDFMSVSGDLTRNERPLNLLAIQLKDHFRNISDILSSCINEEDISALEDADAEIAVVRKSIESLHENNRDPELLAIVDSFMVYYGQARGVVVQYNEDSDSVALDDLVGLSRDNKTLRDQLFNYYETKAKNLHTNLVNIAGSASSLVTTHRGLQTNSVGLSAFAIVMILLGLIIVWRSLLPIMPVIEKVRAGAHQLSVASSQARDASELIANGANEQAANLQQT
ncbi:MAG: hypothetical protein AAF492_25605, partial [Verrucomicrobiota bacterium]